MDWTDKQWPDLTPEGSMDMRALHVRSQMLLLMAIDIAIQMRTDQAVKAALMARDALEKISAGPSSKSRCG